MVSLFKLAPDIHYWNALAEEVGDVTTMINLLITSGHVTQREIDARTLVKESKLKKWSKLYDMETLGKSTR